VKETAMQKLKGLEGLLAFLKLLRSKKIAFTLEQDRDDSIMVYFTLVGARVEVDFFIDHMEFSAFTGDEKVENDEAALMRLIDKYWD
jgi:hypothetical protein